MHHAFGVRFFALLPGHRRVRQDLRHARFRREQQRRSGYSPYNIEKAGDDRYRVVMAVAGFTASELNITQKESELLVSGKVQPSAIETEYLYRGIAGRDFERRFQLAEHVRVTGASLANGQLTIELKREIPEEKKARAIPIEADKGPRTITQQ